MMPKNNFFWGAVFGGIAALLFAPKTGKEFRKELSNKYRHAANKGDKIMDTISDQTEDLVEQAKELAFDTKKAAALILHEIQKEEKKVKSKSRKRR